MLFTGRHSQVVFAVVLGFLVLFSSAAHGVPLKSTNGSGSAWNVDANWSGGNGLVPVDGESIDILHSMTVSDARAFGDSAENSTWTAGTLTITGGNTLTHDPTASGSTFSKGPSDRTFSGGGTLHNSGTFAMQTSLMRVNANTKVDNDGTFLLSEHSARFYFQGNGSRLNNLTGGTIEINLPLATNSATIDGATNVDGNVVNTGNPIKFTQGILNFAPPNGGTLDDTLFANLFDGGNPDAPDANSPLRLGGGWDAINLTAASDLTNVTIGYALHARAGGTTLNVPAAAGGLRWNASSLNAASGRTITNTETFIKQSGSDVTLQGTGTLRNEGTMEVENHLLRVNANTDFDNVGMLLFSENGSRFYLQQNGSRLNNLVGGTVEVSLPAAGNSATIDGAANVDGNVIFTGNPIVFTQGILNFAPPNGGTLDDARFATFFGGGTPPNANSPVRLGGGWDSINLTAASDLSHVTLGYTTNVPVGGTTLNVTDAAGGLRWTGGSVTVASGRTITNTAKFIKATGADATLTGGGTFLNQDEVDHQNNLWRLNANTVIDNEGTFTLSETGSRLYFQQAGSVFNNLSDGILRASAPSGVAIIDNSGAFGTINNLGTVEVTSAELDVANDVSLTQFSAGTLTGGTWKVLAGAGSAILDLHPADAGIDTIGSAAKVVLGGVSSQFNQLSSTSLTVDGTFGVQDQRIYGLSALTMGAGGILEFGLEGIDEGGTLTTGINVGSVNFANTQIDLLDLGGLGVGTYRLMEFTSSSGTVTLGDDPGGFNFNLNLVPNSHLELSVVELPEPSSFFLSGIGLLGMIRHTRRRRLARASK